MESSGRFYRRKIIFGASLLAGTAAFVNAVSVIGLYNLAISHVTGNITRISIDLATNRIPEILPMAMMLLSFFVGAFFSGFIIDGSKLVPTKRYGAILIVESTMIFWAAVWLDASLIGGEYILSAACGMQNAMATMYGGAVIRTTHMTGVLTDLGILVGNLLRKRKVKRWPLFLYGGLLSGFLIGGTTGSWLYTNYGFKSLYLPASGMLLGGAVFVMIRKFLRKG